MEEQTFYDSLPFVFVSFFYFILFIMLHIILYTMLVSILEFVFGFILSSSTLFEKLAYENA